jgi:hypothetical protein
MLRQPVVSGGIFDRFEQLRCSNYYHHVYWALGRTAIFVPFGALPEMLHNETVKRLFGDYVFIRPDAAIKEFTGKVISTDPRPQARGLPPEFARARGGLVVLADKTDIGDEYRVFCRHGKAVCSSSCDVNGRVSNSVPKGAIELAEKVSLALEEACGRFISVDIGIEKQKPIGAPQVRLIEVNGVNSAGLYGCDVDAFVNAMEAEAEETVSEWISPRERKTVIMT